MADWLRPRDIEKRLQQYWGSGRMLVDAIDSTLQNNMFPIRINLHAPSTTEISTAFTEVSDWISELDRGSKESLGFGYSLQKAERNHRLTGRNMIPEHAIIETRQDALLLIKKTNEEARFINITEQMYQAFPDLVAEIKAWLAKNAIRTLKNVDKIERMIAVMVWFRNHPNSGLYMRELDIPGVDTKFLSGNWRIMTDLLRLVLGSDAVDDEENEDDADESNESESGTSGSGRAKMSAFETEFGLRSKPATVRFRVLDESLAIRGLTDISIPIEQFAALELEVSKVFITENEVNGLSFPSVRDAIVVFGLGYGVEILRQAHWLADKQCFYWGDIDTHGFAILNMLRSFLPQAESLLMDEQTLLDNLILWGSEDKQFKGELPRLNEHERRVYDLLRDGSYTEMLSDTKKNAGVRLEQERIPFSTVEAKINQLA